MPKVEVHPGKCPKLPVADRRKIRLDWLPADGNIAKTENHAPARCESAKAHLGPETRKQEHQIKLAANRIGIRSSKNSVTHGLALRAHCGFHEQRVGSGMPGFLKTGNREWSQGLQARRLEQIRRRIIRPRAQRHTQPEQLTDQDKYDESDCETACRGDG